MSTVSSHPTVPTLMRIAEVAEALSVSRYVVDQLRRKGVLPGVLVNGGARRWHPDDIIAFQRNGHQT